MKFRRIWHIRKLSSICLPFAMLLIGCEDPDTTPPTIRITNPSNGTTLRIPVTIKVDASDEDVVDMVEFIVDGKSIGVTSEAPFDFKWNISFWADGKEHSLVAIATDPSGNEGASDTISVTVSESAFTLILISPFVDEILRNTNKVPIRWQALTDAVSYELEVSTDQKFVAVVYAASLSDPMDTTTALTQTVHYWRVRGLNDIGEETEWSDTGVFLIDGPEAPELIGPANQALITGVSSSTFDWKSSKFAALYEINASLSTNFTSIEFEGTTAETTLVTTALGNGKYSWRVRARNSVGFSGNWSSSRTFIHSDVTIFAKTFGESFDDEGSSVHQTDDGGYIIAGHLFANGHLDVILIKTDSEGNQEWSNKYDFGDTDFGLSLDMTSDGGYIITGYHFISAGNPYDILLIKTDGAGNELWRSTFDRSVFDVGRSVKQTTDGGYIIAGRAQRIGSDGSDVWLIKTDAGGNEEWNKTYGDILFADGRAVLETGDGGFIIAGELCCTTSSGLLLKTDANGTKEWGKEYQGIFELTSIKQTSDGGYILGGSNGFQPILLKTDVSGTEEWRAIYSGFGLGSSRSAQQTLDGGFILTGIGFAQTESLSLLLLKTDALGIKVWQKLYGVGDGGDGRSVQQTADGGFIITGKVNQDIWLIKTDLEGNTVF